MKILLRALAFLLVLLVLALGLAGAATWWVLHRSLPQLDGSVSLPELASEVVVDRDHWGVPRIQAKTLTDLVTAQGYVVAQDRLWQMDVLRRIAAGELSEIFGPAALVLDRENRTLGLRVAAEQAAANLDGEARALLEAYARGVNRYIQERRNVLPWEFVALRYEPRRWTPADSFLVYAYMYKMLTSTWRAELNRAKVTERVGAERARELYVVDSPLDHFIVGGQQSEAERLIATIKPRVLATKQENAWRSAQAVVKQFETEVTAGLGSNNWVVDGAHTYSGKPMLANDPHLPIEMPSIWYMVHLIVRGSPTEPAVPLPGFGSGWNAKGVCLPGIPLIIVGHNERIAWGVTNNGADVQDLYIETFNADNPRQYRATGKWIPAEIRKEVIRVRGRPDETLEVVVTRHGPIVHRERGKAYALRWTATQPGGLEYAFPLLGSARNWLEFREVLRLVPGPAQNFVYADVDGNIGFIVAANIPIRKRGTGAMPVPGDTDDYDWIGYIPFDQLPQILNPAGGVIATANARVVGPAYRWYITDRWGAADRTARIYELLMGRKNLRPEDFLAIQMDIVSLPLKSLAEHLAKVAAVHKPSDSRTRELLARLVNWDGRALATGVETSFVEFTRRALMRNLLRPALGNELQLYDWWRRDVFLDHVLRERPKDWLPSGFASYDELLMRSADEAVRELERVTKSDSIAEWRWGRFIPLQILHPIGQTGILRRMLSIGPLEQSGAGSTVKATGRTFGPSMRLVADLSDFDKSLMHITTGQSGQYLSSHCRDQFPIWLEGQALVSPFSEAAAERVRAHRLRLLPAPNQPRKQGGAAL